MEAEYVAVDPGSRYLTAHHLARGTSVPEIKEALEKAAELEGLDPKEIAEEIRGKQGELLERLGPWLDAWRHAEENLETAAANVAGGDSENRLLAVAAFTTVAIVPTLIAAVVLAIFVGNPWSGLAFLIAIVLTVPLVLALRIRRQRELIFSWEDRRQAVAAAETRFEFAAANLAKVMTRETINARLTSFSTRFRIFDQAGLRSLADPEREVSTTASEQLTALMASLSSGSIGLAGPRGSGKTTLVHSFARGRSTPFQRERIGLVVSAPVRYDAKEFVLHLFASLCEKAIGGDVEPGPPRPPNHSRERIRGVARFLEIAFIPIAAAGGAMLLFDQTLPEGPKETGYFLLGCAAIMLLLSALFFFFTSRRWKMIQTWFENWIDEEPQPVARRTPESLARDYLEQIRFQQSISAGWSGTARLPLGISIGADSSITTARAPWSLPEAVDAFRRFASRLTEDRYLVIGIDEMDKMQSDEAAQEFLNNVKGVFGIEGCYYLVSISDDAMASFEQRGMSVRDVFDSSFDDVQRIGYLSLSESRAVLDSRVIGLPIPYQCLCHSLSGGLPRDLIRVTRELVHQAGQIGDDELDAVVGAVVRAELRARTAGAVEVVRGMDGEGGRWVQGWLDQQSRGSASVTELRRCTNALEQWGWSRDGGIHADAAGDAAFEMSGLYYYAATIREVFSDASAFVTDLADPDDPGSLSPLAVEVCELLAEARQQFSLSTALVWETLTLVREKLGLDPWNDPRSPILGQSTEAAP